MSKNTCIDFSYLESLPPDWDENLLPLIRQNFADADYKLIVLDDDPTGTQTVRDLPVLTTWSVDAIEDELKTDYPAFFILTNSRSLPEPQAVMLSKEIGANIKTASDTTGVRTIVISRSDSTLRGHFPAEVDAAASALGKGNLPYLLVPFFLEGGRYTVDDTHYVKEKDKLIPAAQTPFAKDAAFGFSQSNLKDWVAEKTRSAIKTEEVVSVTLNDIRKGGPDEVARILSAVPAGKACIVNSVSYRDMEVVIAALQRVEANGKEFLYRTAASFVRTRTGLDPSGGLLSKNELASDSDYGGLFVIGSYVEKTSTQIQVLFEQTNIIPVEVNVQSLLDKNIKQDEITRVTDVVTKQLLAGEDTAIYTSRRLVTGTDAASSLEIGQIVSDSLIDIVTNIAVQPRYLVAKGGITSSDVATKGLNVRRAMVIGQALPGVPAWKIGSETRYPGMTYIIFPGNVGEDDALAQIKNNLN